MPDLPLTPPFRPALILIDCDEVLLRWHNGFRGWVRRRYGIVTVGNEPDCYSLKTWLPGRTDEQILALLNEFNNSSDSGFNALEPCPGAVQFMHAIKGLGYRARVITACSVDRLVQDMRISNLLNVFGSDAFETIDFVGLGASKADYFAKQERAIVFDDLPRHARDAQSWGHNAFVVSAPHNARQRHAAEHTDLQWIERLDHFTIPSGSLDPKMNPFKKLEALS